MIPKIYVSLIIAEESVSLELLDLFIELGVTVSWHEGQLRNKTIQSHKNNGCAIKAQVATSVVAEDIVKEFWNYLTRERMELLYAAQKHSLTPELSIAIYANDIMPSIHLDSKFLRELSQFNIEIDIDIILTE